MFNLQGFVIWVPHLSDLHEVRTTLGKRMQSAARSWLDVSHGSLCLKSLHLYFHVISIQGNLLKIMFLSFRCNFALNECQGGLDMLQ